jgi:hypothetical protein
VLAERIGATRIVTGIDERLVREAATAALAELAPVRR